MKRLNNKIIVAILAVCMFISILSFTAGANYYSSGTTLYYGMTNSEVTNLQNDLKTLGYFTATSTGYFGSITKQSVINFQSASGLTTDGIVGKNTAKAIKAALIIKTAKSYQGIPYVYGGSTPSSGFDCSGFTSYVFAQNGITIPRTAATQYNVGTWVSRSSLKPGDLVFFTTTSTAVSHVGIYIGNDQFIHASSGAGKIIISSLSNSYYSQHYIGAKRII